jgi:aspartyl protease family protein
MPNNIQQVGSGKTIMLQRGLDRHYRAEGKINDLKVTFLIDTGATETSISADLAKKIHAPIQGHIRIATANGDAVAQLTRLTSISLGGIERNDIPALISPGMDADMVLLGMNFLDKLKIEMENGVMTISEIPQR